MIRCCVRCWGLWGLPSSSDWSGHAGCVPPDWFRGSALLPWEAAVAGRPPYRRTAMERHPYHAVAQERDPPVVSGRWRVLGAASRRAIASRKAVPADVKEPFLFPFTVPSKGNTGKHTTFPRPTQAGFWTGVYPFSSPCRRYRNSDGSQMALHDRFASASHAPATCR